MGSIADLFRELEPGTEDDSQIDIDKVLAEVTNVLNDRPSPTGLTAPGPVDDDEPPPAAEVAEPDPVAGQPDAVLGEDEEVEVEAEVPPPPPTPLLETADPLLELPPERRAALLALDQTIMADEAKRAAVFKILSGDSEAPAPPRPTLPEHIDPESFEAELWRGQQEIRAAQEQMAAQSRAAQEQSVRERAHAAATEAGNRFAAKYADRLTQDDVVEIARFAGQSGITASFASTAEARANPVVAFEQALESTLWTNEAFRARVLGTSGPSRRPGTPPRLRNASAS